MYKYKSSTNWIQVVMFFTLWLQPSLGNKQYCKLSDFFFKRLLRETLSKYFIIVAGIAITDFGILHKFQTSGRYYSNNSNNELCKDMKGQIHTWLTTQLMVVKLWNFCHERMEIALFPRYPERSSFMESNWQRETYKKTYENRYSIHTERANV